LKPACTNSLRDPISKKKKPSKIGLVEWFKGEGPEFKPWYHKKKKKSV
jgi:hypothetical protein